MFNSEVLESDKVNQGGWSLREKQGSKEIVVWAALLFNRVLGFLHQSKTNENKGMEVTYINH